MCITDGRRHAEVEADGARFTPTSVRPTSRANRLDPLEKRLAVALDPVAPWAVCLATFQSELSPQQFATWIRPLRCEQADGQVRLLAPNRFVLQWVRERFGHRIEALMQEVAGAPVAVEFAIAAPPEPGKPADPARAEPARSVSRPRHGVSPVAAARRPSRWPLPTPLAPRRPDRVEPQSVAHVRGVRHRQGEPARPRGRPAGRRPPDVVQPAVRLRRRGARQDAPDPGDRQPHPRAEPRRRRSATSTPSRTSPTSCAPTSTRASRSSSATTARSTCC